MSKRKKKERIDNNSEDSQYIIEYIRGCKKRAEDATIDRRNAWKELWQVFQCKQNYSKKQSWQSKVYVPKLWMKVEKAAGEVKRALMNLDKLWKFTLDSDYIKTVDAEEAEAEMLEVEKGFKKALVASNFSSVYAEMIKSAFLLGVGVPKVLWDEESNNITFEHIEVENCYISPDYKPSRDKSPRYFIETQFIQLSELIKLANKINESSGMDVYDIEQIDKLTQDSSKRQKQDEERKRKGLSYSDDTNNITLDQFWGSIVDKDGKEVKENQLVVIANGDYIIRHQDNPFSHGVPPYPLAIPLVYPHRGVSGVSLVEPSAQMAKVYNNLFNMMVDNLNWSVNKTTLYNPTALDNPKEIFNIYPGKMIPSSNPQAATFPFQITQLGRDAFEFLSLLKQEIEEGTAVTEFLSGMPSDQSKTLGEIQIKTAESRGLFDTIARDLETTSLKPLLEMAYSVLVQFGGAPDISNKYQFSVGGLSLLLMQKEQAEAIERILMLALKSPAIGQMTDLGDLWQKFLGIYNLTDVYQEQPEVPQQQMPGQPMSQSGGQVTQIADARARAIADARQQVQVQGNAQ